MHFSWYSSLHPCIFLILLQAAPSQLIPGSTLLPCDKCILLHAGAQPPLLSLTETLSFFFDSSLLDITSSFSSCPFSMFTVLLPLLGNMSYFGLLAGVGFFMWLFGSAHHLCCHHMAITFCCTSVTALFQLIRKMYAHTLSSPYVLWHVLASCFFGTSLLFCN